MTKKEKEENQRLEEFQNSIQRKKQAINICMHKMKFPKSIEKCEEQQVMLNEIYEKLNKL